jgi:hypothetical protein
MTSYAEDSCAVSPLSEEQEVELASELMEVGSDAELEEFLGGLIGGIARDAGRFLRSPAGHALGGILKGVAKKALPMVGGALGSAALPGIGTVLGSQLGSIASNMFEMELGPMPEEEAEFEVSRHLVQLMAAATRQAVQAPRQPGVSPKAAAWDAVLRAARQYAPGLYRQLTQRPGRPGQPGPPGRGGSGLGQGAGSGTEENFGGFRARAGGGWSGARSSGGRGSGGRGSGGRWSGGADPGGRRMPAHRQGRGRQQGFRSRHGHGRPADGGGFAFAEPILGEPVIDQPVNDEPVVEEPVVEEPILQDWDPIAGPDGQASLEVGEQPRQAASGTWKRQGRRIILRGV